MVLDVSRLLFARHLRAEPTSHVLFFKAGELKRSGAGLAFWFLPLGASVSAVPLDDRELPILIKGRTADFQDVTVNGSVVWRVTRPADVARRVDFSVDVDRPSARAQRDLCRPPQPSVGAVPASLRRTRGAALVVGVDRVHGHR
jgi:hypothetical protein